MFKSLVPKDRFFFETFDTVANNVHKAAHLLNRMLVKNCSESEDAHALKTLEHETDQAVHDLMSRLHRTFVTPIDREDIHHLACRLDDILDQIEAAGSRLDLYRPRAVPAEAVQLSAALLESTKLVKQLVALLNGLKDREQMLALTVEIKRLEDEADHIKRATLARLFLEEKDPFELIKWKDVLEYLERATDRCEDVADISEGIVLENT